VINKVSVSNKMPLAWNETCDVNEKTIGLKSLKKEAQPPDAIGLVNHQSYESI